MNESGFFTSSPAGLGNNLTQNLMHRLGISIIRGDYKTGQSIPTEKSLCDQYSVSRIIVREAVKMLTAKGMLLGRMSKGTFVMPEAEWNLLDRDVLAWMQERETSRSVLEEYAQVRRAIEPVSAGLAAKRASSNSLAMLESSLDALLLNRPTVMSKSYLEADFHVRLIMASENKFYCQFQNLLRVSVPLHRAQLQLQDNRAGINAPLYLDLYDNIVSGCSANATQASMRIIAELELI